MRLARASIVVPAAVALIAAGCGSSNKSAVSATTAAATPTTTLSGPRTVPATFSGTRDCRKLAELGAKVSAAVKPGASMSETIDQESKALHAMADAVPSEIRGDFQTFVKAWDHYVGALAKLNLKTGQVPNAAQLAQLVAASKEFSSAKLQAAEQHLVTWAQKNCGVPGTG